jgi:hypothetical protein
MPLVALAVTGAMIGLDAISAILAVRRKMRRLKTTVASHANLGEQAYHRLLTAVQAHLGRDDL